MKHSLAILLLLPIIVFASDKLLVSEAIEGLDEDEQEKVNEVMSSLENAPDNISYSSLYPEPRGEFELADDYKKRRRSTRIDYNKTYYLDFDIEAKKYDIDSQQLPLLLKTTYGNNYSTKEMLPSIIPITHGVKGNLSDFQKKIGSFYGFDMTDVYSRSPRLLRILLKANVRVGSYVGSNAFGVTADIESMHGDYYALYMDDLWGYGNDIYHSVFSNAVLTKQKYGSYIVDLKISPQEARKIREGERRLKVRMGIKICGSKTLCFVTEKTQEHPSIDNLYDYNVTGHSVLAKTTSLLFYYENTKEILEVFLRNEGF